MNPIFIIPIAIISFIAFYFLSSIFISDDKNSVPDETEEENTELPLPDVIGAKVVKKRVGGECTGVKIPKYNAYFWITFLTDDGKELTFNVSQELFDKTNEGDVASLVTINDTFLDFTDGEEIIDNEIE